MTAVYTSAGLDEESRVTSVTSMDVERVQVREIGKPEDPKKCPDLTIRDIGAPSVSCPGGRGTCTTKFDYTVANVGFGDAGPFIARSTSDPGTVVDAPFTGLLAGQEQTVIITTPPGGSCFDNDCTISVSVDIKNEVDECDEGNNTLSETTGG